jgi:hypothetical protein
MRRLSAILIAALAFGALSGAVAYQKVRPQAENSGGVRWQEIAWPYPRDGWPAGRAFRCDGCAGEIELYVRPKIGFCNCDTGVADDDEVDRVADLDLISERFAPLAPGKVIRVGTMAGRLRAYDLDMPGGVRHAAVGIAVSHRCDLMVAVAQGGAHADELQREALQFMATSEINHWMMAALGGR